MYPGRLSFLPVEPYVPKKLPNAQKEVSRQTNERKGNSDEKEADNMENNTENPKDNECESPATQNSHQNKEVAETSDGKGYLSEQKVLEEITHDREQSHVDTPLLTPLSRPVPSDWITIEDDFIFLLVSYQSHISDEMCMDPQGELNDGVMSMGFVRNNQPGVRKRLLNMMLGMGDGSHLKDPGYEVVKVRAFRLEPLNESGGHLCVDGEEVKYGPIQAQVLPGMARVMAKPKVPRQT